MSMIVYNNLLHVIIIFVNVYLENHTVPEMIPDYEEIIIQNDSQTDLPR